MIKMKTVMTTALSLTFLLLSSKGTLASHDPNNDKADNIKYPISIYNCDDRTIAERQKIIDLDGGIEQFTENRLGAGKYKINVGGKILKINPKYLRENCLFVYGDESDVPNNKVRDDSGTTQWLYLGYSVHGTEYPNPAYPEWFAREDMLDFAPYKFYKNPWTTPWDDGTSDDAPTLSGYTPNAKNQNPNDSNRIKRLAKAIDKYSNGGSGIGHFDGNWIKNGDASVLSQYADVIYLGDEWTAGTFTMWFYYDHGPGNRSGGFATFFIPPTENPFDYGDARSSSWLPAMYHNEPTYARIDMYNKSFGKSTRTPCDINSTTYVPCLNDDPALDYTRYWTMKIYNGFDAGFNESSKKIVDINLRGFEAKSDETVTTRPEFTLPAGDYTMWVRTPSFKNETNYGNNYMAKNFTVKPVDLEVLSTGFSMTPDNETYSTRGVKQIQAQVRNNTDKGYDNVKVYHYWEGTDTVYCETVNLAANATKTVTLSASNTNACEGSKPANNVYPSLEGTNVASKKVKYVIKIDGADEISETDETNNTKKFDVTVNGLNASADMWVANSTNVYDNNTYLDFGSEPNNIYHQLPFYIRMDLFNDMRYYNVKAPCGTGTGFMGCADSTNTTFKYEVRKGTSTSGTLVDSGDYPVSSVRPGEMATFRPSITLPEGTYTIRVFIPRYSNEYTFNDNVVSKTITVKPVALEVGDTMTIAPGPAQDSDTPITKIAVDVKNNSDIRIRNVQVKYYWEDDPTNAMCKVIPVIEANSTVSPNLLASGNACPGYTSTINTEYQRYEDLIAQKDVKLVVHVDPDNVIPEANKTDNKKSFNVKTNGLNASVVSTSFGYYAITEDSSKVRVKTVLRNDMAKPISGQCLTNFSINEICKYASSKQKLTYYLYDTNWTSDTSDDVLMKTWSVPFGNIQPGKTSGEIVSEQSLPPGEYRLVTEMPYYKYEYKYTDNRVENTFEVDITKERDNIECKNLDVANVAGTLSKFCLGLYPRYPSTEAESGAGVFYYLKYRFFPSPIPPYIVDDNDATNKIDSEGNGSNWNLWSFYSNSSYWTNPSQSTDTTFGNVFKGNAGNLGYTFIYDYSQVNGDYRYNIENGKTYEYSIWMKSDATDDVRMSAYTSKGSNASISRVNQSNVVSDSLTTSWKRYRMVFTADQTGNFGIGQVITGITAGREVSVAYPTLREVGSSERFENGLKQRYVLNEPSNELGDVNRFLYYTSAKTGNHYKNRGRLFAKSLTFNYKVVGPNGAVVPNSQGSVTYNIPATCYSTTVLDFNNSRECREVTFYIPNNQSVLVNKTAIPSEENRLKFQNPGKHQFVLQVVENQVYRYQTDNGDIAWSDVQSAPNFSQTNSDWRLKFSNPMTNHKAPASVYGLGTWDDTNDLYNYKFDFTVTGISSSTGH